MQSVTGYCHKITQLYKVAGLAILYTLRHAKSHALRVILTLLAPLSRLPAKNQ